MKIKLLIVVLIIFLLGCLGIYYFTREPKIITVYHDVDLRADSVVVILENAPSNNKAMYDFWLKNKSFLKEKYNIELNKATNYIVFMKPVYIETIHVENEYCFSKYIKDGNQCIDKDQIEFVISHNFAKNYFRVFFSNPFCVTHFFDGKSLSNNDKCFK